MNNNQDNFSNFVPSESYQTYIYGKSENNMFEKVNTDPNYIQLGNNIFDKNIYGSNENRTVIEYEIPIPYNHKPNNINISININK